MSKSKGNLEKDSHDLDIRLRGTKCLSKRPTYIGNKKALTHLLFSTTLFYFILFYSM
jgi:hypothetical protein